MKPSNVNLLWKIGYGLLLGYIAVISFLELFQNLAYGFKIGTIIAVLLSGLISFYRGANAHAKQLALLEKIIDSVTQSKQFNDNIAIQKNYCHAYVQIVLYAMYQAYSKKPFDYRKIDPDNNDLIRLIVKIILSAYKSENMLCYIGDDNMLVVDEFKKDEIQVITDGRKLVSEYEHFGNGSLVKACVHRINVACGINETYSASENLI